MEPKIGCQGNKGFLFTAPINWGAAIHDDFTVMLCSLSCQHYHTCRTTQGIGDSIAIWDEAFNAGVTYQIVPHVLLSQPALPTGATLHSDNTFMPLTSLSMYRMDGITNQHEVRTVLCGV
jgi:hypothetical protein